MEYIEFTGKTVDEALTAACEHFTKPSELIEYEVLSTGSTGFLGLGAKPALINARVKEESKEEKKADKKAEKKQEKVEKKQEKNEKKAEKKVEKKEEKSSDSNKTKNTNSEPKKEVKLVDVDEKALKESAEKFLKDVFASMNLEVTVKSEYIAEGATLEVELAGPEMGVLIGKRGQTLDSLQYLTSLVVNKDNSGYVRVKVDTENYRSRRKETLENLAKNISYKVKRTRKSVSLEPMNPYERRIIHSALQGDKYVTTHSEGEEPFRRVVVTPKR